MTQTMPLYEFLLFDGFSNIVLANAMEPLRDVRMRSTGAELSWRISSLDGAPVTSSSLLRVTPDQQFDPQSRRRALVLVAGYGVRHMDLLAIARLIRKALASSDLIIAVDGAPWMLAATGLLNGRQATVHWHDLDAFADHYPDLMVTRQSFVRVGRYLTCGGASSTLEMILDLIRQEFGAAAAFDASTMFLYDANRQTAPAHDSPAKFRQVGSERLLRALDKMALHIEDPVSLEQIARAASTSERSLNRMFLSELGLTPGRYYRLLRLKRARELAQESNQSLEQIALRCGFSTASALSRAFSREFGAPIGQSRRQGGTEQFVV